MIGSILGSRNLNLNGSIVYGTGFMTSSDLAHGKPKQIFSVRGPLTRNVLLQQGIDCPENYGDPALLLPMFYQPEVHSREAVAVIPNIGTFWDPCPLVDELVEKYHCKLVNMTRYEKWTDIIDAIASSSFVISESLHGLIVAETYGIPSVWAEFIEHKPGRFNAEWSFKFRDFYESIGKHNMTSLKLYEGFSFDELLRMRESWQPGEIDYTKLLEAFPFKRKS